MTARSAGARTLVSLIQLYRHTISPLRLPTCRFTPTCSQYAVDALTEFGVVRGGWLALLRLAKCGPWHNGGWDPIPDRPSDLESHSDAIVEHSRGGAADGCCGIADHRGDPVQQGKSHTSV